MNHTPAQILQEFFLSQDVPLFGRPTDRMPWPLYVSFMPEDDIHVCTEAGAIYDTTPSKDGRLMTGEVVFHYGIQIKIRSLDYITGWKLGMEVQDLVETIHNAEVALEEKTYTVNNVSIASPLTFLGRGDLDRGRVFFSVNFLVTLIQEEED